MSNTFGGWTPQDPSRRQPPDPRQAQDANPHAQQGPPTRDPYGQAPQPLDPYGPRDPYGRPANPYGRPDYRPAQQPEQRDQQPGVWGQGPGYQQPQAPQQFPQYTDASGAQDRTHDQPPTIGAAWRWGWSAFGASWGLWVLMSLALGVAQIAVTLLFSPSAMDILMSANDPAAVDAAQAAGKTLTAQALAAAGTAVCFLLQALLCAGALAATRTRRVVFRDFFLLRGFGSLLGYALLTGALGFVSITVPMVGWLVQVVVTLLLLPVPFLILNGVGFGRALAGGVGLVLSHIGTALTFFAIFAGLVVASIPTCLIGLVVVVPAMLLMWAYLVQRWTGDSVQG
ncbi:hypothetical protein [Promicromonospora soli]|uniref:Uncharacterized protein n=1 Tax=Promicromonospora soli TaxID=2035533 RepID=A0A919KP09_9MICO|nr:hypothetical protein [Promicromonospora soli]GHH67267.1 hypothetical protein GCM10017772_08690 [Promicromonospora soli]